MLRCDEMTRATKGTKARRDQPPLANGQISLPRGLLLLALLGVTGLISAGVLLWRSSGDESTFSGLSPSDPGPVHVHGLGVNPTDGALFIATHTGLYRVSEGQRKAERVGERYQDTMGFTIVGPNRFLGSGHPDLNEAREKNLPSLLGLIESTDSGETWQPISLLGEADFHVLRFAGERVYGYDSSNDRLLVSGDGGESWQQVSEALGLLAWPTGGHLYLVAGGGQVFASRDGGRRLEHQGEIGGQPAALVAEGPRELYVALHDGTIKRSTDGGATWTVRSTP